MSSNYERKCNGCGKCVFSLNWLEYTYKLFEKNNYKVYCSYSCYHNAMKALILDKIKECKDKGRCDKCKISTYEQCCNQEFTACGISYKNFKRKDYNNYEQKEFI